MSSWILCTCETEVVDNTLPLQRCTGGVNQCMPRGTKRGSSLNRGYYHEYRVRETLSEENISYLKKLRKRRVKSVIFSI